MRWPLLAIGRARVSLPPVSRASLAAGATGALMLALPAVLVPGAWPVAAVGVAALIAALPARWPAAGTLAAVAAVVTSGIGITSHTLPLLVAAAEATLVLVYLLALDRAESGPAGRGWRWLRGHVPVLAAGAAAATLTTAAVTATVYPSPWLTVAGLVACAAALVAAAV